MKKPLILCVDDEKLVLDSLLSQLNNAFQGRFLIETADHAEDAWEVMNELVEDEGHELVVLISDWLMPFEKGDTFLINVANKYPKAKLIMLSGHADDLAVERAERYANLHEFIRKPWEKDHLLGSINAAIASRD
jgi:FixJ family two-component response regulator